MVFLMNLQIKTERDSKYYICSFKKRLVKLDELLKFELPKLEQKMARLYEEEKKIEEKNMTISSIGAKRNKNLTFKLRKKKYKRSKRYLLKGPRYNFQNFKASIDSKPKSKSFKRVFKKKNHLTKVSSNRK